MADVDVLESGERLAVPAGAAEAERGGLIADGLRVGEVDDAVVGELRMQHDVLIAVHGAGQTGNPRPERVGTARDGLGIQHAVTQDANLARARRDEHVEIGQDGQAPRKLDLVGDDDDADIHVFAGLERERPLGQRLVRKPERGDGNVEGIELNVLLGDGGRCDEDRRVQSQDSEQGGAPCSASVVHDWLTS